MRGLPRYSKSIGSGKRKDVKSLKTDPKLWVDILPQVHIGAINWPIIEIALAVWQAYKEQGVTPIVTGADDPAYVQRGVHDRALALDFRIWNLPDPARAAERIREQLWEIDLKYVVLYGDKNHLDHIHVGYGHDKDVHLKYGE